MKICIDAGHYGKYNQSPWNKSYYESDMNWKLHNYIASELTARGVQVVKTRTEQAKDLELTSRGKKAKGCDLFLSIHSNASGDSSQDSPWACVCVSGKADKLGKAIADTCAAVMGTKQLGRIYKRYGSGNADYYGVLRGAASVGVTGILMEHSFHTNPASTAWLLNDENLKKLAKAEAETICKYYGIVSNVPTEPQNSFAEYRVKALDNALNIRKTPVWDASDVVGCIKDHGTYTIVAEKMLGDTKFGKLKSGAGWISLGDKYVKKV